MSKYLVQNGTYLRNGPGLWHLGDYNFRHLFSGYATLVRLHIENGRLIMGHRQIESEAYKAAKKTNKVCHREFSESPYESNNFLSYIGRMAKLFTGALLPDNANIGVFKLGDDRVICLAETINGSIVVDPTTLETIGRFEYDDSLGQLIQSPHPIVTDEEFITVLPDLINPGYTVVRTEPGRNERKFIGRVDCRGGPAPGWLHSFSVTERYVIVPEMPLRYCPQNLIRVRAANESSRSSRVRAGSSRNRARTRVQNIKLVSSQADSRVRVYIYIYIYIYFFFIFLILSIYIFIF
ncbi:carotenoid cleavage dioxygenase 8 homolog B, chloroplastic-like [Coffea arabica]|uniref:Carotenoid cleavage dioxygenase 8 homolog B, chloroplastic-like n=1 Tax=Coffea arabica TaxID=13443 RepID=A0ABM4VBR1_COFAR